MATTAAAQSFAGAQVIAGKSPSVEQLWAEYERACGQALSDPQGFLDTHPKTGVADANLVVTSPDNQIVTLYHLDDDAVYRQVQMMGVPGELHIVCEASGGNQMTGVDQWPRLQADREQELRNFFANVPGATVGGGTIPGFTPFTDGPGGMPDSIALSIQTTFAGKPRFVIGNIFGDTVSFGGAYVYDPSLTSAERASTEQQSTSTQDAPAPAETGSATAMRAVVETCLRNYREPQRALSALEAVGMTLTPAGLTHHWEFSGQGVFGNVAVENELYCSVQSNTVPLETAQAIGTELAESLFPDLVQPGAPEGGTGPCDGLSIFAPRQMIWLRYAQAGNSGECINDGTSAIILN